MPQARRLHESPAGPVRKPRRARLPLLVTAMLIAATIGLPGAARATEDPLAEVAALQQQAAALYRQGRSGEIAPLLERAIAILQQKFGPDDPRVADSLGYLADLYE